MIVIIAIRMDPPNANDHARITDVRWKQAPSGDVDTSTMGQMVSFIDAGNGVHVTNGATAVAVGVVRPATGSPFLRTHADGRWSNNLLALSRY